MAGRAIVAPRSHQRPPARKTLRAIYWPEQRILTEALHHLTAAVHWRPLAAPPISSPICEPVTPSSSVPPISSASTRRPRAPLPQARPTDQTTPAACGSGNESAPPGKEASHE